VSKNTKVQVLITEQSIRLIARFCKMRLSGLSKIGS